MYEENGITMTPAVTDRINGWAIMLERLGNPSAGVRPTLFIHKQCKNLISQIPMMQNSETRPGDVEKQNSDENGDYGDDAADCCRYGLASAPVGVVSWALPVNFGNWQAQKVLT
jgi:hypothetical protein